MRQRYAQTGQSGSGTEDSDLTRRILWSPASRLFWGDLSDSNQAIDVKHYRPGAGPGVASGRIQNHVRLFNVFPHLWVACSSWMKPAGDYILQRCLDTRAANWRRGRGSSIEDRSWGS